MKKIVSIITGKRVLFISTKNKDYIRNQQEIRLLQKCAGSYEEIVFHDKSYIKRIIKVWWACCTGKCKKAEVIFVGFAPQLVLPFLKHWNRKRMVIIDFFISMYDTCVCDRTYFKKTSQAAKLLHYIDRLTLMYCAHIIVDTKADRDYFSKEFGVAQDKMEVLYLEADKNMYYPIQLEDSSRNQAFCVLYFGSILPLQGIDVILNAVKLLRNEEGIHFIIIGPIGGKEVIADEEYPNAEFYEWLSQDKLAEQIAKADLCLAGHFNSDIGKARRTIPGKAYIYEAMGKPMILGENDANHELFQEDDYHFFVEMGNAKALADLLLTVRDRRKSGNE